MLLHSGRQRRSAREIDIRTFSDTRKKGIVAVDVFQSADMCNVLTLAPNNVSFATGNGSKSTVKKEERANERRAGLLP